MLIMMHFPGTLKVFDDGNTIFTIHSHNAIEFFEDGGLILNLRNKTLIKLDKIRSLVISCMDGQHSVAQIVVECVNTLSYTEEEAKKLVYTIVDELLVAQMMRLVEGSWKGSVMNNLRYIQNPDVNLREEDEEGALLYNPDADRVQLLNNTGLQIWKLCAQDQTINEIVDALIQEFEESPSRDQIITDVEEFVNQMVDSGFIGILEAS